MDINIKTLCETITKFPEFQNLYEERQNYPYFATCIDDLLNSKITTSGQLIYCLLWQLASLSVNIGVTNRSINMAMSYNQTVLDSINESNVKTYIAEMRNMGFITESMEVTENAQSNGYRSSDEGDPNSR